MAKKSEIKMNLPSVDDLFSTQEERDEASLEKVQQIPIGEISEFKNHPFKVKMDEDMEKLIESIKDYGILSPALVRTKADGGYEMVAGHRRMKASELAGLQSIPALVRELSDDEATILMVDSNLQREEILPSEKAFAYKLKLDAMKRQAGRPKQENGAPVVPHFEKGKSRDLLANEIGENREQIRRYIRLTNLTEPILEMVDEGRIAFRPAVELSYLDFEQQEFLLETMECEDCTPSLAQAIKMKRFAQSDKLTEEVITSILQEEKPNQVEQFKIPKKKLTKYFPEGTSIKKIEDTIISALDLYQRRDRDMER